MIGSAEDGLAEALFDLASVVNQHETTDLALLYDRFALDLQPHLAVAQLLLADILSGQNKPQESLAVLAEVPANSRYSWSAQLRAAANLETLGRIDEAVAELRAMAAKEPGRASAQIQLGDLLRGQKRFSEAADAYSEAIRRLKAAGTPPNWGLYYSRGIAFERSGQWNLAEADLEHALELKPDQPLVLNYLGYSWIDRGEKLKRGLQDDRKGGGAAAGGRLHRRQPGLGALPARRVCGPRSSISKRRSSWCPMIRRSTIIWATPIGRAGARSKPAINGGRPSSSDPTRKTSSRSRSSSKAGYRPAPPPGPAAAEAAMAVTAFAPAKVNLYLHVTGQRADGYHLVDSLVAFADIGDQISARPSTALTLAIDGPEAAGLAGLGDDNLVLRAARLLADHAGVCRGRRATFAKEPTRRLR